MGSRGHLGVQAPRNGAGLVPPRGRHGGYFSRCHLWGWAWRTASPDTGRPAISLNCPRPLQKPPTLLLPPPGPSSGPPPTISRPGRSSSPAPLGLRAPLFGGGRGLGDHEGTGLLRCPAEGCGSEGALGGQPRLALPLRRAPGGGTDGPTQAGIGTSPASWRGVVVGGGHKPQAPLVQALSRADPNHLSPAPSVPVQGPPLPALAWPPPFTQLRRPRLTPSAGRCGARR